MRSVYGEGDNYPVGAFPSYRVEGGDLYLCRPIANILGLPRVEKTNQKLDAAIGATWSETAKRLTECAPAGGLDLNQFNIENTLPGKSKMRQDVLKRVREKTIETLNDSKI